MYSDSKKNINNKRSSIKKSSLSKLRNSDQYTVHVTISTFVTILGSLNGYVY